jgi:RNA polymerase sigma-70 factor (ECF subfamily)
MNDEDVIERVLAGDIDCFGWLVEKYQSKVAGLIFNMTRDFHLTEDLCQEVFMNAYKGLPGFDSARSRFSTWLYRITQNKAINAMKKRRNVIVAQVPQRAVDDTAFQAAAADELHDEFDRLLDSLPVRQRVAFVWSEIEQLSYNEIARIEGVSLGTVKSRIFRARQFLQQALQRRKGVNNE